MGKIKARESQNVEYKSSWHDKYLEWICGFANAQGAVMYFGVNDDHEVIGLKNIANAFFKAGFIDAWGRGYKKIREGFENAGLPMPVVENFCGGVRVMFQRKNATDIATDIATVKLNKTQEKIIAILHVDKYATYDVIAKQLGIERTTVWRNIKKLQEHGRLRRIGGDNGGHWEVIVIHD